MDKEIFDKTPQGVIDDAKRFVIGKFKHETESEQLACYKHIEDFPLWLSLCNGAKHPRKTHYFT